MVVAGIGIVINGLTAALFASGRKSDVNIEGAFLHMAADAAVSVGVLIAGAVILYAGWIWLDPVVSLLIVLVIAVGTWDLLRRSFDLAMDAVPAHIDPTAVRDYLAALPGVSDIHDFHIWAMSTTETALTAHLIRSAPELDDAFLHDVSERLHHEFHIHHVTIQIESGHGPQVCHLSHEDSV
jgi:cobalt-zinc-cadmium efflux system protein